MLAVSEVTRFEHIGVCQRPVWLTVSGFFKPLTGQALDMPFRPPSELLQQFHRLPFWNIDRLVFAYHSAVTKKDRNPTLPLLVIPDVIRYTTVSARPRHCCFVVQCRRVSPRPPVRHYCGWVTVLLCFPSLVLYNRTFIDVRERCPPWGILSGVTSASYPQPDWINVGLGIPGCRSWSAVCCLG